MAVNEGGCNVYALFTVNEQIIRMVCLLVALPAKGLRLGCDICILLDHISRGLEVFFSIHFLYLPTSNVMAYSLDYWTIPPMTKNLNMCVTHIPNGDPEVNQFKFQLKLWGGGGTEQWGDNNLRSPWVVDLKKKKLKVGLFPLEWWVFIPNHW